MGIAFQQNFRTQTFSRTVRDKVRYTRQNSEENVAFSTFPQVYVSDNFAVKIGSVFKFRSHVCSPTQSTGLFIMTEMTQLRPFSRMDLSSGAVRMNSLPNAGGSSLKSEVLSYEILQKCFGAELYQTELEVQYFPGGGPIVDYTCKMFEKRLAVSVTRAMKFYGEFTIEDATHLLVKKLSGVVASTRNTMEGWEKQILHIWTTSFPMAMKVAEAYFHLRSEELKRNTIVLVTVASNTREIFNN